MTRKNSVAGSFTRSLPVDASSLTAHAEPCHCVADAVLENRYNTLRAEEHARRDGKCGPEWTTKVAQLPENGARNRYNSIVPWDHSRVVLPVVPGENDYINASWIELGCRTYIATQGPLHNTVDDFWQMIYAYGGDPAVIVMLTPLHELGMEKCARYWPENRTKPLVLGKKPAYRFGLEISTKKHHTHNNQYEYSELHVTPINSEYPPHTVHHIYYHTWLDFTKPDAESDLRSLIYLVNNHLRNQCAPPIIHCSAGIGRTGTYMAMDALISRIDKSIIPSELPTVIPFWKAEQSRFQFKKRLFEGGTTHPEEVWAPMSTLFSKFDMSAASGTYSYVPTVHTHHNGPLKAIEDSPGLISPEERSEKSAKNSLIGPSRPLSPASPPSPLQTMKTPPEQRSIASSAHDPNRSEAPTPLHGSPTHSVTNVDEETLNKLSRTVSGEHKSSALSGPLIEKISPTIVYVSQDVFSETPDTVNVMKWFDPADPVMSTVRTMRKQRPKLVQGKQQLGYIYDQFEIAKQLDRASGTAQNSSASSADFLGARLRDSQDSTGGGHKTIRRSTTMPTHSQRGSNASAHHKFNILNLVGIRRHGSDVVGHQESHTEPSTPRKWSPFHSTRK